jgi:hypothetical protein
VEVFEFIEETFDRIALHEKPAAEGRWFETIRHGADIFPGPALYRAAYSATEVGSQITRNPSNQSAPYQISSPENVETQISAFGNPVYGYVT